MFPVLKDMLHRRGGDLSGGQQQQLAIGRALAGEPKLLILDEPTEGIQPSIIKDIERVIRALAASGEMAILLVEQYYDFARSLADSYVVMSRGEVIRSGRGADMERDNVGTCSPYNRFDESYRTDRGPGPRPQSAGWEARLALDYRLRNGRSVLSSRSHSGRCGCSATCTLKARAPATRSSCIRRAASPTAIRSSCRRAWDRRAPRC